jgi:lipopolysaccharide/colanic/teichoic acid biosynthesis glycosyltransferase
MLVRASSGVSSIGASCPEYISGQSSIDVSYPEYASGPAKIRFYHKFKRLIDIVVVFGSAPAVLLVLLVASAAIYLLEGRPIFFAQNRVGRGGRVFRMLKLRTMLPESCSEQIATVKDDPRITPLGKFLRQSHIDELPQLWNILVGDMTLIGPRPEQPALVDRYREQLSNYDLRHAVPPGLSGWAQVNVGYAADLAETARKLDYDLEYVQRYGPLLDFIIIVRTFRIFLDPRYVR